MKTSLSKISKKLLLFLTCVYLCFACGQKKIESKVIDNQGVTTKKEDNPIQFLLDSTINFLTSHKWVHDTSYINQYVKIMCINSHNNTSPMVFICLNTEEITSKTEEDRNPITHLYHLTLIKSKWNIQDSIVIPEYINFPIIKLLQQDINFDNVLDYIICYEVRSASRGIYVYKLFITKPKGGFQLVSLYSAFSDLNISAQNKTIMTGEDGGIFGLNSKSIYRWNSDTLQEIKRLDKIVILNKQGEMIGDETTEYHLKNNELVVKKGMRDGVDYFEKWQ